MSMVRRQIKEDPAAAIFGNTDRTGSTSGGVLAALGNSPFRETSAEMERSPGFRRSSMRMRFAPLFALLCCSFVAACAATQPAGSSSPLDGTAWVLAALPDRALLEGQAVTMAFDDGRAQGSDGCNRYSTSYTASGSSLSFSPRGMSTRMACAPERMVQAEAFSGALVATERYRAAGTKLELRDAAGSVLATFEREDGEAVPAR
jgi:heat shock protein HslJ